MVSLKQHIAGLDYSCPLTVGSSPLTDSVELLKRAEDNGAASVSTKLSLLYQLHPGIRQMYAERGLYGFICSDKRNDLEPGLKLVRDAKEQTNLVIWANITGFGADLESWGQIAREFEQAGARAAIIRRGTLDIEVFEVQGASPLPPGRSIPNEDIRTHGVKHVALAVEDRQALLDYLSTRGVEVVFRGIKGAFILDNAGNIIELMERG